MFLLSGVFSLLLGSAMPAVAAAPAGLAGLKNPVVFVTQPPIPRELNSSVSNTFLSVVTIFGNHLPDTAHAARGGDLWLLYTNGTLLNLTRAAGYGANGVQHTNGIGVRDPQIYWDGSRVLFSMVVGAPRFAGDTNIFFWQLYELTNLTAVIQSNATPVIVKIPNQPTNYNNVSPCYGSDGRIIFTSDRPFNNQPWLYPQRDEYKAAPVVTGTYSLDRVSGDLRLLEHLPSGAFNPFVDSFGRLIVTRWDHLVQDSSATDDRLGRATNGSFTFTSEAANASLLPTNNLEIFPEPVDFDTNYSASLGVNPNGFNFLLPWALDQAGGNEEVLNHVGRHELQNFVQISFTNDPNLIAFTNPATRGAFGIESANTNFFQNFIQMAEDPTHPGTYFGVDAQDISIFGGNHAAGQIVTLTGAQGLNPTNMVISYITPKTSANGPNNQIGLFRNPLPMSDGSLIAAYNHTFTGTNGGWDTNLGTASAPLSMYHFRLMTMTNTGATWATNVVLTGAGGLTNIAIYYDGATLVTNAGPLWELQPVEVRARPVPPYSVAPVAAIEQQVFAAEGVDLPTFQADLAQRGLALVVSRNVTARDAADKQQPYNLAVPGGVQTLGTNGKIYNISHLQFLQADYLRGYNFGSTNTVQPGRRVLATPMHATTAFNYPSSASNAPIGGTQLMSDGSQATIVPASRAVTWQLTGVTNESIVKERYWLNFRAGEVRTCANCHGINDKDQAGRTAPTNAPLALSQLLRFWKTNSATTYQLTVNQGTGGGAHGAGSLLILTATPATSAQVFDHWTGAGVSNAFAATTLFTMPATNAVATAIFTNLPPPQITSVHNTGNSQLQLSIHGTASHAYLIQTSDDLVTWSNTATNNADTNGIINWSATVNPLVPHRFYRIAFP